MPLPVVYPWGNEAMPVIVSDTLLTCVVPPMDPGNYGVTVRGGSGSVPLQINL